MTCGVKYGIGAAMGFKVKNIIADPLAIIEREHHGIVLEQTRVPKREVRGAAVQAPTDGVVANAVMCRFLSRQIPHQSPELNVAPNVINKTEFRGEIGEVRVVVEALWRRNARLRVF